MKTCMLKFALPFIMLAFSLFPVSAQTTLPYYTGFDNPSQQAGWQEFRKGLFSSFNWNIAMNGFSAPYSLFHDYPVGNSDTDTVIDWYVSPPFHFYGGGRIDSLKIRLFSMSNTTTAADQCQMYLLQGDPDPQLAASVTLLADFTGMASNNNNWVDTGNFVIPPTAGSSYIAIKYRATNDWFVPNIDDIHISGDTVTAVPRLAATGGKISLFPNPAGQSLNLRFPDNRSRTVIFSDIYGRKVARYETNTADASFDISGLSAGAYYITVLQQGKGIAVLSWMKE